MESGKVVCQCPEGEALASDGVTCVGKSASYSEYVLTDYIFLTWCAVMLYSGIVYLLYLDKDECATGEHDCQQICFNTPGSYMCWCDTGYQLGTDGHTCEGLLCSSLLHMYKHPI